MWDHLPIVNAISDRLGNIVLQQNAAGHQLVGQSSIA
jgi:hypothetical protein